MSQLVKAMIDSNAAPGTALSGRRVLIVEDEPFIAFDLADAIENAGGVVVGPAMSVREALTLVATDRVEAAILDVNLPDGDIGPVITALADEGILLLVHTGAGLTPALREQYPTLRVFTKPTPPPVLAHVIASVFAGRYEQGPQHP
jgi:DNA-binding NarL/FixJ family response regulator